MEKELSFQLSLYGSFQAINFPKETSLLNGAVVIQAEKDRIDILSGMLSGNNNILSKKEFIDTAIDCLKNMQELLSSHIHQAVLLCEGILSLYRLWPGACVFSMNGLSVRLEWRPMPENIVNGIILSYRLGCPSSGILDFNDIIEFLRRLGATVQPDSELLR